MKSNSSHIELGQYAKLKGLVSHGSAPLQTLVGAVLEKSFVPPVFPPSGYWNSEYTTQLHHHIEAIWQVYLSLGQQESVGLPLAPYQKNCNNLPVTLCHSNKPVAEAILVWPHDGSIQAVNDDAGSLRKINITASRSLIKLTRILVPGYVHAIHSQCIQWIYTHGQLAVVTTSTLRTRSERSPLSIPTSEASLACAFASPAPISPTPADMVEPLTLSISESESSGSSLVPPATDTGEESDDDNFEPEPSDGQSANALDDEGPADDVVFISSFFFNNISHISFKDVVMQSETSTTLTLPTRVFDDAFHFMDRLERLLAKKHSAYRRFVHDFSEAIFIRDKDDVRRVKAVLQLKNIDWDYTVRANASSLNRHIRREIPNPRILVARLEKLFNGYRNVLCTTLTGRSALFFSKEAWSMAQRLLETARLGYLSDPPGIPLYYQMGIDKDGLPIYRTIRGTNSVEGGVHMAVRRIFGSLQASPELSESLLLNWILRRNKTVCINLFTLYFL